VVAGVSCPDDGLVDDHGARPPGRRRAVAAVDSAVIVERLRAEVLSMSIVLHHHPFSRAATVVWMLEELGLPYTLHHVDIAKGGHKSPALLALNPMGKIPVLVDGEGDNAVVVSETAAIGSFAPALDDPRRGPYLRAMVFGATVVEPCALAKAMKWEYRPSNAGFGSFDDMVRSLHAMLTPGPFLLGDRCTMADICLGATVRYMVRFKMMESDDVIGPWLARLNERPANVRADAKNAAVVAEKGLGG
jgi:glutathione S-transferase